MNGETFTKAIAALLAWREESINGINGMLGVLFVVRNRANAGWNSGDWNKIIESHNQFSSMSVLGDGQTIHYPDPREPNFVKILQAVDSVYDGSMPDELTNGALYYCDPGPGITPGGWFQREILGKPDEHPRVAVVGTTLYFK